MTGGILQLVGKNIEDSILTDNPQISLFKTVFRRYTNFSKFEHKINFHHSLNFGTETFARLRKYGDLLNTLVLVIDISKMNVIFEKYSRSRVKTLLKTYGITWNFTGNPNIPVTDTDLIDIGILINNKIAELEILLTKIENTLNELETNFDPDVNTTVLLQTIDQYFNNMLDSLMAFENNNIYYQYTEALSLDTLIPINTITSDVFQILMFNKIREFNNGTDYFIKSNSTTNIDEIHKFIGIVEFGKYNKNIYDDSYTTFNIVVDSIYEQAKNPPFDPEGDLVPDTTDYYQLDSYKAYSSFLLENRTYITNNTELERIRLNLVDTIRNNVDRNYLQLTNIFNSLKNKFSLVVMKPIRVQRGVNIYDTSLSFALLNLVEDALDIDDKISSLFKYDTTLTFNHYLGRYISTEYNTFLNSTITLFSDKNMNEYFKNNFNTLWYRLAVTTVQTVSPSIIDSSTLNTVYLLNYIPILLIEDIPKVILEYLEAEVGLGDSLYLAMDTELSTISPILLTAIESQIILNISELQDLIVLAKANKKSNTDLLITSIMRPEYNLSPYMIMEYLRDNYQTSINNVIASEGVTNTTIINNLNNILASFFSTSLPPYNTYRTNYRVNSTGISDNTPVFDAGGIIWNTLQNNFVILLNNTYHTKYLDLTYYTKNIGVESVDYLNNIAYNPVSIIPISYKIFNGPDLELIDYYRLSSDYIYNAVTVLNSVTNYIDTKKIIYDDYSNRYSLYKNILRIKDAPVNKRNLFFGTTNNILDHIVNLVQYNPTYGYGGTVDATLDVFLLDTRTSLNSRFGINDIILNYNAGFINAIGSLTNPYTSGTNLYNWYVNFNISTLTAPQKSVIIDTFNKLQLEYTPNALYKDIGNIFTNYNEFISETDIYKYIQYVYILNTDNLKNIIPLKSTSSTNNETNIRTTYTQVHQYYTKLETTNKTMLADIDNSNPTNPSIDLPQNKLYTKIENSQSNKPASFAWIKELGHYMIDTITLKIGGQIVDVITGEWLHLYWNLTKNIGKEKGYNTMIGNTSNLTTFNTSNKGDFTLFIPIPFWFCKRTESSLPMTALLYSNIEFYVKLKPINELAKWSDGAIFESKPKLTSYLIAQYIYLDTKERMLIAKHKHHQLIDQLQFNKTEKINFDDLEQNEDGNWLLKRKIYFYYPVKELIWVLQDYDKFTNLEYNNYSFFSNTMGRDVGLAERIEFKFNGRERQPFIDADYYNQCITHKVHKSYIGIGKYCYNFALYPDNFQPSGTANFSKLSDASIEIILRPEIVTLMQQGKNILFGIYAINYNILNIHSGMAGLVFGSSN